MSIKNTDRKFLFKYLYFIIAAVIFVLVAYFPIPESFLKAGEAVLSQSGRLSLAIIFFCLFLWITEPVPFHITGLIGLILIPFSHITELSANKDNILKEAIKLGFGDETLVFFIGVFTLGAFITMSGLGKRISMFILSLTGNKTSSVILGFMTAGTLLSMWVTDMAVAAMLMPIAKAMCEEEGLKPLESNFGKALLITCGWGPLIGGIGTPAGCSPNIIAMNMMDSMLGMKISFGQWMLYGVPAALLLIVPSWLILITLFKPEIKTLSKTKEELKMEFKSIGPMTRDEKTTSVVFVITIILWLTGDILKPLIGFNMGTTLPTVVACALLFLPGLTTIKWKQVSEDISWDGIILIAAGISIGLTMSKTGAADWLSNILLSGLVGIHPIPQIFLILMIVQLIKVGLSSNAVTATIVFPVMIKLAQNYNIPYMSILMPTALSLSLAFILVTSGPTTVIPYSAGYFKISDMAKAGTIMTVATSVIIAVTVFVIGSFTGLY